MGCYLSRTIYAAHADPGAIIQRMQQTPGQHDGEPDIEIDLQVQNFIARWQGVALTAATELSSSQTFVLELCALLGVPTPLPTEAHDYMFERPITFAHGDGSTSAGRIDCYRRGCFVWESKKFRNVKAGSSTFNTAMLTARTQAENYARALPPEELATGRPPFVLVADVGHVIEVYAEFTRSGASYTPFPDPRSHRIALSDLARPEIRERLRLVWADPLALDPARLSARITREVAAQLADLARSLEQSGHRADHVAAFLTRSLFSMFAEDVELLPKGSFLKLLQTHQADPRVLQGMLQALWADMDRGGFSVALAQQVLRFNGKLFKQSSSDGYSLLLNAEQIERLTQAAKSNWREVEPAIFGTLLERALSPTERHALGAHYTPRAYVERLVLPTVVEPLRADWANAQAAALVLAIEAASLAGKAHDDKLGEARAEVRRFHHQLCTTRVLDPACGSGNFLYVTLEHLKRLEGEVLNQLADLGETQDALGFENETVTPQQLLGIEINERAAALAELVLWIGYLQWHIRTRGNKAVAEPVVHDYGNIEHRDAVLAWDDTDLAHDDGPNGTGQLLSRWDGSTFKTHPVTGALVPDEAALVPQWTYTRPRQALWPQADFIVGNPPFIGASTMRAALGDGYVQALRGVWPGVPESADFVMYWWSRAAWVVGSGQARRFGLITTNSLRQTFNRRVVQAALDAGSGLGAGAGSGAVGGGSGRGTAPALMQTQKSGGGRTPSTAVAVLPLALVFAIPDHPWVDSANGAAVRIAMTVGATKLIAGGAGVTGAGGTFDALSGRLLTVTSEQTGDEGEVTVTLAEQLGDIHADLSVGANVASAVMLQANENLSNRGVQLFGAGFIVTAAEAAALLPLPLGEGRGEGSPPPNPIIRDYRNGRDLTDAPRGVKVIDAFGLTAAQLRTQFPSIYQWLIERVKPERDQNNRASYRDNWWIHGEPRKVMRKQLANLPRYIATVETAKHRTFQFVDASILPDNKLIAIALSDAFDLGILSSSAHVAWSIAAGSTLEDRPVYVKTTCFETFPFPADDTGLTQALRQHIAALAEQIDAHRKHQQAAHPGLTLTGMYNVLEILRQERDERAWTAKEKTIHTQGLVSVLKDLHDELDAAVLQAYGLAPTISNDALLTHLVALNAQRALEEKAGNIRWLRPAYQNPQPAVSSQSLQNQEQLAPVFPAQQAEMVLDIGQKPARNGTQDAATRHWPSALPDQVRAVVQVLASQAAAVTLAEIEANFKSRGAWKKSLPRILETLEALGRARREGDGWRA
jgi:hypothetical protein